MKWYRRPDVDEYAATMRKQLALEDYWAEWAWTLFGSSVVDKADELVAAHRAIDPQDPEWFAAQHAGGMALVLGNMIGSTYASSVERDGMRLQQKWWRAVEFEALNRIDDQIAAQDAEVSA